MPPAEDDVKFIEDEEPKDYFYHYRDKSTYARLVSSFALESELYLLTKQVLGPPHDLSFSHTLFVSTMFLGDRLNHSCFVFLRMQ
jgi:hypothetical protein